ncbi:hypothetical protein AMECASPLE_031462 [Ameca splendens]|uniref:Uncharacterized protein n=1 Tax=Ameca splendens TaxID=208324 RepID=A0ABV0YUW8_9TELE
MSFLVRMGSFLKGCSRVGGGEQDKAEAECRLTDVRCGEAQLRDSRNPYLGLIRPGCICQHPLSSLPWTIFLSLLASFSTPLFCSSLFQRTGDCIELKLKLKASLTRLCREKPVLWTFSYFLFLFQTFKKSTED